MASHLIKKIPLIGSVIGLFFFIHPVYAATFFYTPALNEAQKDLAALRLVKAQNIIHNELKLYPDNIACDYLLEYVEFYKIMIDQDKSHSDKFEKIKTHTIDRVKKLSDNDALKLYLLGSLHFHGAFVKSLFDEYVSAAFEFRTAYQLLEQNQKKFPACLVNQKDLGALMALIGTFPDSYKWIVAAAGLTGDYKEGMKMLNHYILHCSKEPVIEQQQAHIFYALIQLNFGADKQESWQFYKEHSKEYSSNLMQNYVRAYIAGKCGHNDEAIAILNARPASSDFETIPYMNYLMGIYLLNKLDEGAGIWFKKYVLFNPSKTTLKETYQRLAWCSLLQYDSTKFLTYMRLMGKSGKSMGSEEKLVNDDLSHGIYPNVQLVKARLLFDGGYFQKAAILVNGVDENSLPSMFQKIEFEYRSGRVMNEQVKYLQAISHYTRTIEFAKEIETYMAPNACLQMGLIYKKLNSKSNAKEYLNKVLDYKNYDYKSSCQQKAKAALLQLD